MTHWANFLHASEPADTHRAHRRQRRLRLLKWLLVGGVVAFVLLFVFAVLHAVASLSASRDHLLNARVQTLDLNFTATRDSLVEAERTIGLARRDLVLVGVLKPLPWLGRQVTAVATMAASSEDFVVVLRHLAELGEELLRLTGLSADELRQVTFDTLPSATKQAILSRLATAADQFTVDAATLSLAAGYLNHVDRAGLVGPLVSVLDPLQGYLDEAARSLELAATAGRILPTFVGLGEASNTLLLFLNNSELRPGGGFIGTYGVLRMQNGDIQTLETKDVYGLDDAAAPLLSAAPPQALRRYNQAVHWYFRDANWSPDFALGARQALVLFAEETRSLSPELQETVQPLITFQNVVGFTPTFVSDLLRITGVIEAGGQSFSHDDVRDRLEYQVGAGYISAGAPPSQRKEILAELVNNMKSKLYSLPLSEWLRVIVATEQALLQKQLVLYSEDQAIETKISAAGWGGRMLPNTSDVLMLVDASLGSLKADPLVQRSVRYEIFRNSSGQYIARVAVHYAHHGRFDWKTSRYRTYLRLYAPLGSELIRVSGALRDDQVRDPSGAPGTADIGEEAGLAVFGVFTAVEPGEERDLVFEYALAPAVVAVIDSADYALTVLKQIGASADNPLMLNLDFGKMIMDAAPAEAATEWGDNVYKLNTKLDQDLIFHVGL